jgi:hypothetical protein
VLQEKNASRSIGIDHEVARFVGDHALRHVAGHLAHDARWLERLPWTRRPGRTLTSAVNDHVQIALADSIDDHHRRSEVFDGGSIDIPENRSPARRLPYPATIIEAVTGQRGHRLSGKMAHRLFRIGAAEQEEANTRIRKGVHHDPLDAEILREDRTDDRDLRSRPVSHLGAEALVGQRANGNGRVVAQHGV